MLRFRSSLTVSISRVDPTRAETVSSPKGAMPGRLGPLELLGVDCEPVGVAFEPLWADDMESSSGSSSMIIDCPIWVSEGIVGTLSLDRPEPAPAEFARGPHRRPLGRGPSESFPDRSAFRPLSPLVLYIVRHTKSEEALAHWLTFLSCLVFRLRKRRAGRAPHMLCTTACLPCTLSCALCMIRTHGRPGFCLLLWSRNLTEHRSLASNEGWEASPAPANADSEGSEVRKRTIHCCGRCLESVLGVDLVQAHEPCAQRASELYWACGDQT